MRSTEPASPPTLRPGPATCVAGLGQVLVFVQLAPKARFPEGAEVAEELHSTCLAWETGELNVLGTRRAKQETSKLKLSQEHTQYEDEETSPCPPLSHPPKSDFPLEKASSAGDLLKPSCFLKQYVAHWLAKNLFVKNLFPIGPPPLAELLQLKLPPQGNGIMAD